MRRPPRWLRTAPWYGAGQRVEVHDYVIERGMVYVGECLDAQRMCRDDACLINPGLKVSERGSTNRITDFIGFQPRYAKISQSQRGAYLKWLAGDRSDPRANIGYVLLYFYGLERRLMVDGRKESVSAEERAEIVREIFRLLKIYGRHPDFYRYAHTLIAMEWVLYRSDEPVPDYIDLDNKCYSEPFKIVLARYAAAGKSIPPDVAFQWMKFHRDYRTKIPVRGCAQEFRELFTHYCVQRYREGFIVKPGKRTLVNLYQPASDTHSWVVSEKHGLPDPFMPAETLKILDAIVDECTIQLEPFSQYVSRKYRDPGLVAACALLPDELMGLSSKVKSAKSRLSQVCANGATLITVKHLYECFGESPPSQIGRTKTNLLIDALERAGFGLAPHVRFHNVKLSPKGKVVLFPGGYGMDFWPSKEYETLVLTIQLGAMLSQVDSDPSRAGQVMLQRRVKEAPGLSQTEKDSLLAFLRWCLGTPQRTRGIQEQLAGVDMAARQAIGYGLILLAIADGRVDPKKMTLLEKLYQILGFDKNQVSSNLHRLATEYEPAAVAPRVSSSSRFSPDTAKKPGRSKRITLDEDLLKRLAMETREARSVLEEIFDDREVNPDEKKVTATISPQESPLNALDRAHKNLFHRLIQKQTWERSEIEQQCEELGLMADGAMETINAWFITKADTPLIEDGEPVYIDVEGAKAITDANI